MGATLLPGPGASLSLVHAVLPVIYQRLRCHPRQESREKGLSSTCSLRVTLQGEAATPKPEASCTQASGTAEKQVGGALDLELLGGDSFHEKDTETQWQRH